jgi:hypothetical protein
MGRGLRSLTMTPVTISAAPRRAGGFTRFPSDQGYAYENRGAEPLRFLRAVLS